MQCSMTEAYEILKEKKEQIAIIMHEIYHLISDEHYLDWFLMCPFFFFLNFTFRANIFLSLYLNS